MSGKKKMVPIQRKEIKQPVSEAGLSIPERYNFIIPLLLITIMAILIYSNTFSSPFYFDDQISIIENYQIRDLSNFWPPSGMRYIGDLSFAINYYFGGLNVFGYHLINLIIHIINGILVWWLVILMFKTPRMEGVGISRLKGYIAITSALIFVSHPIQTQAVTYIVQRYASLATMFYLISLVLFVKGRLSHRMHNAGLRAVLYISLSILSAILAMKTKEISFTLPFVIALYEFMFWGEGKGEGFSSPFVRRLLYLIPLLTTLLIIPLSMVGVNKPIGDIIGELRVATQEIEVIPRGVYLLTQFRVIVTYIRLLFLPINQNLDYHYPLYTSFFTPGVFLSFIFLLSIFSLAIYLFIRSRRRNNGYPLLLSSGILWFFMTLSVESSIIPIRDVIFEHRLYLPSVGAVIAFSATIFYCIDYVRSRVSPLIVTCIMLLFTAIPLGIATYNRNAVWKDGITLWQDVVRKSPAKGRGYASLVDVYYKKGRMDDAIYWSKKALEVAPYYPLAHYNTGVIYHDLGRIDEAIREYREALRRAPDYLDAHLNLGTAYYDLGRIDEAIVKYREALNLKPDYPEAHYNLGLAYFRKGRVDEAIAEFREAIRLKPDYPEPYYNLGVVSFRKGQIDEAIAAYREALRLKPDLPRIREIEEAGGLFK